MIVIEILFDSVFSLVLTELKRRLIPVCNALCKLFFFFIGKELQRNGSIVLLIVFVNLVPGSLCFPTSELGRGERWKWKMGLGLCLPLFRQKL